MGFLLEDEAVPQGELPLTLTRIPQIRPNTVEPKR